MRAPKYDSWPRRGSPFPQPTPGHPPHVSRVLWCSHLWGVRRDAHAGGPPTRSRAGLGTADLDDFAGRETSEYEYHSRARDLSALPPPPRYLGTTLQSTRLGLGGWAGVTKRRKVSFHTTFMWKRRCRQRASRAGPSTTLLARDLYALPNPSCSLVACLKSTRLGLGGVAKRRKVRFMWSTKTWSTEKGKVKRPVDPCFGKKLFLFFSVISSCILPSADSIAHTYARRVCGAVMLG
jgi:hypothetical protein